MLQTLQRFEKWLAAGQCIIRDKHARLVKLRPNLTQRIMHEAAKDQARAGKPIRQIYLKARKHGITTWWQAFAFFMCQSLRNQVAMFMAHREDDTKLIFEVVQRIADNHRIVPVRGREPMRFTDTDSLYWAMTAGGENVGAGGTPTFLHLSEVALWKTNKQNTLTSSREAVPFNADTVIIQESTARGHEQFYTTFNEAHADIHPYNPMFFPWFFDYDCRLLDADPILIYDDEETVLIRMAKRVYDMDLDDAQLSWRRMKIAEIGPNLFRQEYPATPEEAVRSHRGLVLPGLSSCVIERVPFLYSEIPFDERVGGFDYGYSDPTALVSGVYRDQKLYVIRTYRASGKLAGDYAGEVMDGHTYYCDPANPGPRDELASAVRSTGVRGCSFVQAPRASGTGERSIVKQEWDIVRRWVVEGRILIVRGEHEQLCAEADTLEWNEKTGEPDKTRTPECGHFDTIDALRYLVMGLARTGKMIAPRRRMVPSRREQLRSV